MQPFIDHQTATLTLTREMSDLARMRDWLAEQLRGVVDPRALEEAVVMANELVVNVVMHTTSLPTIATSADRHEVRIAVHDLDPGMPVMEPADPRRARGNGLRIIDTWACRWGTEADPASGKWVWFVLPRA